jgi:cytochrome P460
MQIVRTIGLALMASAISLAAYGQLDRSLGPVADAQGRLQVPTDYRSTYQFLGAWAVAADQGQGSKGLHLVYASPGTVDSYRRDGHFADGSVLVKEVFETASNSIEACLFDNMMGSRLARKFKGRDHEVGEIGRLDKVAQLFVRFVPRSRADDRSPSQRARASRG